MLQVQPSQFLKLLIHGTNTLSHQIQSEADYGEKNVAQALTHNE